jgi:1-acyl-sn-glycerol-3-phosphate acyltransferase
MGGEKGEYDMNPYYAGLKLIGRVYTTLLPQDCKVFGAGRLPQGAKIIAANHPNCTDTFFLPWVIKDPLHTLIQGSLFHKPLFGRLLAGSGQIPVYPGKGEAALRQACRCLADGQTVLIYPEAQWNPENKRLPGKPGAVMMSLVTGVPIIPLGIHVPDDNTRWVRVNDHGLVRQSRWQIKGRCYICIGDPWLPSAGAEGEADPALVRALTEQLMDKIYHQTRLAIRACRLEAPGQRSRPATGLVGLHVSEGYSR